MSDEEDELTQEQLDEWNEYTHEHLKNYETRDPSMPAPPSLPPKKKGRRWAILRKKKEEPKRIV